MIEQKLILAQDKLITAMRVHIKTLEESNEVLKEIIRIKDEQIEILSKVEEK